MTTDLTIDPADPRLDQLRAGHRNLLNAAKVDLEAELAWDVSGLATRAGQVALDLLQARLAAHGGDLAATIAEVRLILDSNHWRPEDGGDVRSWPDWS